MSTPDELLNQLKAEIDQLKAQSAQTSTQQAMQTKALRQILEGKLGGAGGAAGIVVALEGGATSLDVAPFVFD